MNKTILIAVPTNKYIEPETMKSIYDLIVPDGYVTEFQFFYGYSRSQILNLVCEWGKRYYATLLVRKNDILPENLIVRCINENKDAIRLDDYKAMFVKGSILQQMTYPHFIDSLSEYEEKKIFFERMPGDKTHLNGEIKTVGKSIF